MGLKDWDSDKMYIFMAFLFAIIVILGFTATEIVKELNKPKQAEAK